ncbi:MAG: membrane protein insertase YidC [Verrucomicrobiales bacterium]|nr:membrane protein insertase YidC [Verrucomicrobiales bacterium]
MDRTSWIAVLLCTTLLFLHFRNEAKKAKERAEEAAKNPPIAEKQDPNGKGTGKGTPNVTNPDTPPPSTGNPDQPSANVETIEIAKDQVIFELTNQGAGISKARLLEFNEELDQPEEKVTLNENSGHPIGAFSEGPGQFDRSVWQVKKKTDKSVTFATTTPEKLAIEKKFYLTDDLDDYEMRMDVTIRNESGIPQKGINANRHVFLGSASPMHLNEWGMQIGFFWKQTGEKSKFSSKTVDYFKGGWFGSEKLSFETPVNEFDWAGVHGQFFATMLKSETPSAFPVSLWASRIPVIVSGDEEASKKKKMHAVQAAVGLNRLDLDADNQATLSYRIFAGPKQYERLKAFGDKRQLAMNYDRIPIFGWMFGWAIKPLASALTWGLHKIHSAGIQYGIAIMLITVIIRILIWPVYAKSTRTMKRMSKLTPKMTELREKYADEPQKMNEETMKLYRQYGVNPLGGCLPMFIQMPVFLAFYRMLWSEVDLRHVSFLWVDDLSMPDNIATIAGFPINLLPLIMAATTFIQMSMTPKTGDKTQRMIFMLMPFIFLVICYNFAAALSLYWTTQNIFSIFQTWLMNKLPEPELKKKKVKKGGFMERLQEQAAAQQKAKQAGGGGGGGKPNPADRTKLASEKGDRHTKPKKKRKKR